MNSGVQISSAPPNRTRPCQSWTSPHSGPIDFLLKIKFNQHATNGFDFSIFIHTWCCKDDLIIYQPGESLTMYYSSIHRWLQVFTKAGGGNIFKLIYFTTLRHPTQVCILAEKFWIKNLFVQSVPYHNLALLALLRRENQDVTNKQISLKCKNSPLFKACPITTWHWQEGKVRKCRRGSDLNQRASPQRTSCQGQIFYFIFFPLTVFDVF